jgi:WD40 repeat protein
VVVAGAGAALAVHRKAPASVASKPLSVTAAPADLVSAAGPNASGESWVLVNTGTSANVQLLNPSSNSTVSTYPVSKNATSVATNELTLLAIGQATAHSGAVTFLNPMNGKTLGVVPVAGPVQQVVAGSTATQFVALVQSGKNASAAVLDAATYKLQRSVPLSTGTLSVAVSPDGATLYTLQGNGTVQEVSLASGKITQSFATAPGTRALALSPNGSRLYILKGAASDDNVSVVSTTTESQLFALPAPVGTVTIATSADGSELYDFVGTPQYSNMQVFATSK